MTRSFLTLALMVLATQAWGQISVRSPLSDDRDVQPGSSYEGTILVRNETDEPQEAHIYQTDYLFYSDGTNRYDPPGSHARSNANWVQFSPARLVLPPGQTIPVSYSVSVPDSVGATAPAGSYWSMLMVEGIPHTAPTSSTADGDDIEVGVQQVTRYGVQVASHISAQEAEFPVEVAFNEVTLRENEAAIKHLDLAVENTGGHMVRPAVWIEVYDAEGAQRGRFEGETFRIYPTTSVQQSFALGALPPGTYHVLVVLDAGDENLFGAQYTLSL